MKKIIISCIFIILILTIIIPSIMAESIVESGDYKYKLENDTAIIQAYIGSESQLIIPEAIDGYNVVGIADMAFSYCDFVSVVIPDGVTEIGNSAFNNCESLTNVIIGNGVISIEEYTFGFCKSLKSVVIGDSVTSIERFAFTDCENLESVTMGNNVKTIKNSAFSHCKKLGSIKLPYGLTEIESLAFFSCTDLSDILIPESVSFIGEMAFRNCGNLKDIYVYENSYAHTYFKSQVPSQKFTLVYHTSGVELSNKEFLIKIGEQCSLIATVYPANAYNKDVIWSSSDENILRVDENGNVTRLKNGFATITVTTVDGGYSDVCTACNYTVSYDLNSGRGSVDEQIKVHGVDLILSTKTPERTYYDFVEWKGSDGRTYPAGGIYTGDSDITLKAVWDFKTSIVTFDACGGNVLVPSKKIQFTKLFGALETPIRAGYTFEGWFTEKEGGTRIVESSVVQTIKDFTVYAHWSANSYTVTFNAMGGSVPISEKTVTYDFMYDILPIPTKKHCKFTGWFLDENYENEVISGSIVKIEKNTVLYARWENAVITGDISGDHVIDTRDAIMLAQHLAKWSVDMAFDSADCNFDEIIDTRDAILLAQYLAKWNVTLG